MRDIVVINKFLNGNLFDILNYDLELLMDQKIFFSKIHEKKTKFFPCFFMQSRISINP